MNKNILKTLENSIGDKLNDSRSDIGISTKTVTYGNVAYTELREIGRGTYGQVTLYERITEQRPEINKKQQNESASDPSNKFASDLGDPSNKFASDLGDHLIKNDAIIGKNGGGVLDNLDQIDTSNLYVIKKIPYQNGDISHDILKEVDTLCRFNGHPYIANFVGLKLFKNDIQILMKYHGISLLTYIHQHSIPELHSKSDKIFTELLSAIDYLHRNNVIHRDIKPENILIDHTHKVTVCDFGLSKAFVINRNTPKVCSLNYRAPELLLKKTDYTMSIDIWALGCVFYEFLTQKTLFVVANKQELLNEIQRLNKKQSSKYKNNLLRYVPDKYKIPISKHMLCYDPEDRSSITVIAKLLHYKLPYTNYTPFTPNDKSDYIHSSNGNGNGGVSKLSTTIIKNRLKNRKHMLKLISDLAKSENFFDETIFLAYELMDRYMSQCNKISDYDKYTLATSLTTLSSTINNNDICNYKTKMSDLEIVAISSLRLASKFLEIHPYQLDRLELTLIQKNIIYQCEKTILCSLKWIVYTTSYYEILKTYVTSELNSVGNKSSDVESRNSVPPRGLGSPSRVLSQPRANEGVPNNVGNKSRDVESRNSALSQPRANEGVLERRKKLAKYMYKNYDISKQSHLQIKNTIATIFSYKE